MTKTHFSNISALRVPWRICSGMETVDDIAAKFPGLMP